MEQKFSVEVKERVVEGDVFGLLAATPSMVASASRTVLDALCELHCTTTTNNIPQHLRERLLILLESHAD